MNNDLTIVFVDDDKNLLKSLNMYMKINGFSGGHFFDSWKSASAFLADNSADILVLDISMPLVGGLEALEEVKSTKPDLPVYMLSAINEVTLAVKALKLGAIDYFLKPLDWSLFINDILLPLSETKQICNLSPTEKICNLKSWYLKVQNNQFHYKKMENGESLWKRLSLILFEDKLVFRGGITLRELADSTNSNTTYLSRFFNEVFQMSFPNWLKQIRIATFIIRVEQSEYSGIFTIESYGQDLGFKSRSAFYNGCKSVIGINPNQFIQIKF